MLTEDTYRVLHVTGLMMLFFGLGAILLAKGGERAPRGAMALHGIGLIVILVAGFGLVAKRGYTWPWPWWLFGKLGIWLLLGAMPVLVKRDLLPRPVAWVVALGIGALAAWLVIVQPS